MKLIPINDKEELFMKKTVVVLAHPSIERRSLANKIIIEKIKTLEGVKIKYFY